MQPHLGVVKVKEAPMLSPYDEWLVAEALAEVHKASDPDDFADAVVWYNEQVKRALAHKAENREDDED